MHRGGAGLSCMHPPSSQRSSPLTLLRVKGRFFDAGGVSIHFTDEGRGAPLVLLHGFAVDADLNWRLPGIVRSLRKEFRVIAMDLRGHGLSGKPHDAESYGRLLFDDVWRLLDHLGLERAHVAGYSLGGFVTLKLATTHPERLVSASVLGAGWESLQAGPFGETIARLVEELETKGSIGPVSGHLGGERRAPSLRHRLWVQLATRFFNDRRALAGVLRGTPALAVTEAELRALRVPVCSITGSDDTLVAGARALVGRVPDLTQTVLPGADHVAAPLRRQFRQALAAFLRAHPG